MKKLRDKDIILPETLMPGITRAFADKGLSVETDIKDCTMLLNESKGTCFLKYKYMNDFDKGKLICTYKVEGTGFTWGMPHLHYFTKNEL